MNVPRTIHLLEGANRDCVNIAWGIMANAYGGDWDKADPEWVEAVRSWEKDWKPYSESRTLGEAAFDKADMKRRMANLRARRGPDDPVMAALDRGELPPDNWNEPRHPAITASFSTF